MSFPRLSELVMARPSSGRAEAGARLVWDTGLLASCSAAATWLCSSYFCIETVLLWFKSFSRNLQDMMRWCNVKGEIYIFIFVWRCDEAECGQPDPSCCSAACPLQWLVASCSTAALQPAAGATALLHSNSRRRLQHQYLKRARGWDFVVSFFIDRITQELMFHVSAPNSEQSSWIIQICHFTFLIFDRQLEHIQWENWNMAPYK